MVVIKINKQFRKWLSANHDKADSCLCCVKVGKPPQDKNTFWYVDAVYTALCYGWIDSVHKNIKGLGYTARFSPRRKSGNFSQLNLARCRYLIRHKLMTKAGLKVIPNLDVKTFKINKEIKDLLANDKVLAKNFYSFPKLYQIVRIDNIQTQQKLFPDKHKKVLNSFITKTKQGLMYGQWNDWGRLSDKDLINPK